MHFQFFRGSHSLVLVLQVDKGTAPLMGTDKETTTQGENRFSPLCTIHEISKRLLHFSATWRRRSRSTITSRCLLFCYRSWWPVWALRPVQEGRLWFRQVEVCPQDLGRLPVGSRHRRERQCPCQIRQHLPDGVCAATLSTEMIQSLALISWFRIHNFLYSDRTAWCLLLSQRSCLMETMTCSAASMPQKRFVHHLLALSAVKWFPAGWHFEAWVVINLPVHL